MSIIGYNVLKLGAERKEGKDGKINVQNNITINNVEESSLKVGTSDNKAIKFNVHFSCRYAPDLGYIVVEGEVVALLPKKDADAVVKEWNDHKRVGAQYAPAVLNAGLNRSQILALILAREVNLPAPVQLPKVIPKMAESAEGAEKPVKKK